MPPPKPLALGELAVLALLAEEPRHGWAIVRELSPDGELGRIWSLSRPLTYRAMDTLGERALVRATGTEPGRGPRRTILRATASGRREVDRWLATPVGHLRDVRTELLLKLVLGQRRGRDPRALLHDQLRAFEPIFAALEASSTSPDADLVDAWRHESAESVRRFLETVLAGGTSRERAASRRARGGA